MQAHHLPCWESTGDIFGAPAPVVLAIGAGEISMAEDRWERPLIILVGPFQCRWFCDLWHSSLLGPCTPAAQTWSINHVPWPLFVLLGNPGAVATANFLLEVCLLQAPFLLSSPQNKHATCTRDPLTLSFSSSSADLKPQSCNTFKQLCFWQRPTEMFNHYGLPWYANSPSLAKLFWGVFFPFIGLIMTY